jgi:lysozyme family protein
MTYPKLFEVALNFTLKWEGGYVNHPKDPGGPTKYGITQKTYDECRKQLGLPEKKVSQLTYEEAEKIYFFRYWAEVARVTEQLWFEFRVALFDTFVQFGVSGGTQLWQMALGIKVDGIWGPITESVTKTYINRNDSATAALALVAERIKYRAKRVKEAPGQAVFLGGWLNRDTDLMMYVLKVFHMTLELK